MSLPLANKAPSKHQVFEHKTFNGIPFEIPTRYKSNTIIGLGAYGQVISAKCVSTGKHYAIKKLENIFRHPVHAKRAIREVKILKQLKHEGIVQIIDLYMDDKLNDLYIVSPLMDTDLHKVIQSSQKLIDKHIQFFVYQILRSLLYMQSAGVMHRDLKPSNIFVDLNCDIKVGDLGMAKVIDYNPNNFVPMTEYVATRWYRAPEIMMWKAYGFEVDVWSVGCIMAELLTRKPLFPGHDLQDQLRKVFSILGTPTNDFIQQIQNKRTVKWIQSQSYYPPQSLAKIITGASPVAIDLLSKMLQYSPYKRISVSLALQHPYFAEFHDPQTESVMPNRVKFPHDVENFGIPQLKDAVLEEVRYYAKKNNYSARTEINKSESCFSQIMPTIGSLKPEPMNVSQPQTHLAMVNGTPMILTPVIIQGVPPTTYMPQMHQLTNQNVMNRMYSHSDPPRRSSHPPNIPW
eukprot:510527_1